MKEWHRRPAREHAQDARATLINLKDTLLNIGIAIAILGGSYAITHFFARAMYLRCTACGTLNARRRTNCRNCEESLR